MIAYHSESGVDRRVMHLPEHEGESLTEKPKAYINRATYLADLGYYQVAVACPGCGWEHTHTYGGPLEPGIRRAHCRRGVEYYVLSWRECP